MGIVNSREPRRLSFDNTFALDNSALAIVPKSIEECKDANILHFEEIVPDTTDLIFPEKSKYVDVPDVKENDYWMQRIEEMKKEHNTINKIIETEYDKQLKALNQNFEPPQVITHEKLQKVKPCFDWRNKVIQCYENNRHQPLECSSYVQAFSNSVASCRVGE